ncbi:hypothetical protein [Novosphingobium lentum]|uniref:hypothetical protein n=1 Tax=Novosphingobium lentum TaxID=145287 RepID=UPI000835CC7C|nr:hypothetical protein [Novosphingobium lentum]
MTAEAPLSRAINLDATEKGIRDACTKHGVKISTFESLPEGGTRVVLLTGEGAAVIRGLFANKILSDRVRRIPYWGKHHIARR